MDYFLTILFSLLAGIVLCARQDRLYHDTNKLIDYFLEIFKYGGR